MPEQPAAVRAWHAVVQSGDPALLYDLLASAAPVIQSWSRTRRSHR
ncbi:MAG: hypothetical protein ACRDOU_10280 [Streptosporangiaceae bacterium]